LINKDSAKVANYVYDAKHETVQRDERLVRIGIVGRISNASVAVEDGVYVAHVGGLCCASVENLHEHDYDDEQDGKSAKVGHIE
jgi:hypothetical protein